MSVNGRWRYGGPVVALLCAGVAAPMTGSAGARAVSARTTGSARAVAARSRGSAGAHARPVIARSAGCGGGSVSVALAGHGSRIVSEVDVPVCATGRITVTFAGDPATGCAAAGLCDYSGTESFVPGAGGGDDLSLVTTESHRRRTMSGTLFMGGNGAPSTSAVQRTVSTGTTIRTTACSDTLGNGNEAFGVFAQLRVADGRVTFDLLGRQPALIGTRCAGPLDADIASALPPRTVALSRLEHGNTRIDLTGSGPFAAHGWSGTVRSTLVLTLGRPKHAHRTSPAPVHPPSRPLWVGTADYRVTGLAGSAAVSVSGAAAPAVCGPFDACGLTGTITVRPGTPGRGSALLSTLPSRVPGPPLFAALRGVGRASRRLGGGGQVRVRGSVAASLTQDGGTCSDTVALRDFTIVLQRVARGLEVGLEPADSAAADPLRTRCPGPDLAHHMLVRGIAPVSVLRRDGFTVALHGVPFGDGPYHMTTNSTLTLSLRRTLLRVRVLPGTQ